MNSATEHSLPTQAQRQAAQTTRFMQLSLQDLVFRYGKQTLFNQFNAHIESPGIYGLFGRNGSGKSTLLKTLCGLLTPAGGQVQVLGYTPRKRHAEFLEQIYLLPEEFHLPNLTPISLRNTQAAFYPRFSAEHFDIYLQELEVPADQSFGDMSLGQKKKATIAFALATHTPILLMDEPTNGLDIVGRGQFRKIMARPEHANRIVLISTHQAHDLESILSHIWFIDSGKLVLSSPMTSLGQFLHMGVANRADALPENTLYQETIGAQTAWVAARAASATSVASDAVSTETAGQTQAEQSDKHPIQLELLYKALSLNKNAVLAALPPASRANNS